MGNQPNKNWGTRYIPTIICFEDETQEIVIMHASTPKHPEIKREKINCPQEYFKRKLQGK